MEELITNQIEAATAAAEVDVVDPEVTPEDVVWSEDEVEDEAGLNGSTEAPSLANGHAKINGTTADDDGHEGGEEEEVEIEPEIKVKQDWKEADCRIIINVSYSQYNSSKHAHDPIARRANIHSYLT